MRVHTPGIRRAAAAFEFRFEERSVTAYDGETIASALIAAGIYGFRETRSGQPRGVFCGMGVCGDCQVLIDGESRRACMEPARAGVLVRRHPARLSPRPPRARDTTEDWLEIAPDVLVIGAGPAGLSAAKTAAAAGLEVLVVDERSKAGGQYFKQPADGFDIDESLIDPQFAEGRTLIRDAQACGVQFYSGATVWGVFGGDRLAVLTADANLMIRPRRFVLSPGAYERVLPVPGWTLPGVMTTGAAQTLLRAYQTAPGRRVVIAGNGPLNLQVADELSKAGVDVACVAELAPPPWQGRLRSSIAVALHSLPLLLAGMRHLLNLRRRGVPVLYDHVLTSVDGHGKASRASVAKVDRNGSVLEKSRRDFDVDAVCVNYGFLPQSELARAFGCQFEYEQRTERLVARRQVDGRSSVPHVYIAGDAGGLGGARFAIDQGVLAGLAIVADLGAAPRSSYPDLTRRYRRIHRRLHRHSRFQAALWQVFSSPCLSVELSRPDSLICRCEEIDRQSLERVLTSQRSSLAGVKKATRAGMGRCQGRYCSTLLAALSAHSGGPPITAEDLFAPRPPAKPVPIGRVARPCGSAPEIIEIDTTTRRDAAQTAGCRNQPAVACPAPDSQRYGRPRARP